MIYSRYDTDRFDIHMVFAKYQKTKENPRSGKVIQKIVVNLKFIDKTSDNLSH